MADDDKSKAEMVKLFFNEVSRENAGRAVREEPPLSYEQCKTKWGRLAENFGGKPEEGAAVSAPKKAADSRSRPAAKGSGGLSIPTAFFQGVAVCFLYNQKSGCPRPAHGANSCKDVKGNGYAHVCNQYDEKTKKHCLQAHPRWRGHK